jgi:two-component system, OmpR family, sensor histidine kinase CpxA
MRSLFLKIFLWFGLAMVLVNIASFVTGILIERRSQGPRNNPMSQTLGIFAQTSAELFEKDGRVALAPYLERVDNTTHIHAVLLNEQGNELSGRTIPEGATDLVKRVNDSSPFFFFFPPGGQQPLAARAVHGLSGARYILLSELPRPDFPRPFPRLGEPGSHLASLRMLGRSFLPLLVIGALFCYWLARYLSTPIVQLRRVTQELSAGKLTARVNDRLLKRRDEIGYLSRDFNYMASRVESLVEAQRRLLGDISHELRSPLARLGVALGLTRRRTGPEVSATLDRIGREAQRLNEMIGQLLSLSRIESGADELNKIEISLGTLVREVADDADFEARARDRSVRVVELVSSTMSGVPELVRSAIENVVRNAVRHTASGTEIDIWLTVDTVDDCQYAVIKVRDQGKGVPEESLAEIFRPFYRVEDARDRRTGGAGLGLSIAARAVRLHKGTIRAFNAPDKGLIVEIRLPVRESVQKEAPEEVKETSQNSAARVLGTVTRFTRLPLSRLSLTKAKPIVK